MRTLLSMGLIVMIAVSMACTKQKTNADTNSSTPVSTTGAKVIPAFELPDVNGTIVKSESFAGKVLVIDFWATWCPPCRQEIPGFIELYSALKDKGVEIIGISLDEDKKELVKFVPANKMNYPVLHDEKGTVAKLFGDKFGEISGIPTTFIVNKKGEVVSTHVGFTDKKVFEDEINKLLAE